MKRKYDRIRSIAFSVGVLIVVFGFGIEYANRNAFYSVDDSFITYRYAFNLLQGNGLVFNVGESYYGTTAAGYATLLALLAKPLFLVFPQLTIQNVSVGVSTLSLMLISACWWVMIPHGRVRNIDAITVWLIFVVMAFVAVPFNDAAGHETYAFLALSLFACVLASKQKMVASAMFLGLAVTLRPDAVLMAPIIVLVSIVVWRIPLLQSFRDRRLLIFSGAFMAVLVPWLIYLQLHFGRAFPGTMDAKRAQVAMGYWPLYRPGVMADYVLTALTTPTLAVLGFGVAGFAWLWRGNFRTASVPKEALTPAYHVGTCWFLFLVLSTAFYFAINVTFWRWYGIPVVFSLFVVAYSGWISALASDRPNVEGWRLARTLVVLVVGAVFVSLTFGVVVYWVKNAQVNQHIYAYHEVADKLKALEPDGTVVAMAEPGAFAVRLGPKFKVVDELGLISPGVAKAYLHGDPNYVYREYRPQYIVCSWKGSYSGCEKPDVIKSYRLVGEFDKGFWQQMIGNGARLYKLNETPDWSALDVKISAIDLIKDVRLGDTWGKVDRGREKDELFIHPGANSDTSFTLDCENDCAGLTIDARIAELPREAPENSGSVRITVLTKNHEKIYDEVLVDRANTFHGQLKAGTYRIKIGNNGDPSYDWLMLRLRGGKK